MTFRDVVRRGQGSQPSVPFHEHDGADLSGDVVFARLKASQLLSGLIRGDMLESEYLTLHPQGGTDEGGELAILGYPGFADWFVDVFQDLWRVRHGSTVRFQINDDGTIYVLAGPLRFAAAADGSAASPAIRRNDTADGFFFAAGVIGGSIGGVEVFRFNAGGLQLIDGTAAAPSIRRVATADGLFFGAGVVGFAVGGTERARIDTTGMKLIDGTAGAPSVGRSATADGLFFGSGFLGFTIGGTERLRLTSAGLDKVARGILGHAFGPASQTDFSTPAVVCATTQTVTVGRRYEINAQFQGTQVTNTGVVHVKTGGSPAVPVEILEFRAAAAGETVYGSVTQVFVPSSTAALNFQLVAQSSAGALRIAANQGSIWVKDIGPA